MAEGLMRHHLGDRYEVHSAGTDPGTVHPLAIRVMAEVGIDISSSSSKHLDRFLDVEFDHVVTVCDNARENCPVVPGARLHQHHSFPDPAAVEGSEADQLQAFRDVRDELLVWIQMNFGT
jgi:arsenate reductase